MLRFGKTNLEGGEGGREGGRVVLTLDVLGPAEAADVGLEPTEREVEGEEDNLHDILNAWRRSKEGGRKGGGKGYTGECHHDGSPRCGNALFEHTFLSLCPCLLPLLTFGDLEGKGVAAWHGQPEEEGTKNGVDA